MAPAGVIIPKLWKDPRIGGLQRLLLVLEHLVDEQAEGAGMKGLLPALPSPEPAPPSIEEMMASVLRPAGPRQGAPEILRGETPMARSRVICDRP